MPDPKQQRPYPQGPERRKEPRKAASGAVTIHLEGAQAPISARLVDISAHGARIRLEQDCLRSGDKLRLSLPSGEAEGRVMWCARAEHIEAGIFLT